MTLRELVLVERAVELRSQRTVASAENALNSAAAGGDAIFHGSVVNGTGTLRMRGLTNMAARGLKFSLIPNEVGCVLAGRLRPILFLRVYQAAALVMFSIFTVMSTVEMVIHQAPILSTLGHLLFSACFIVVFIDGYSWKAVLFTRRIERVMLRAIEYVLKDDASAAVAVDLLSSSR